MVGCVAHDVANLHSVLCKKDAPPLLFRVRVFWMRCPGTHSLLRLELYDRHAFAILGNKALV
jgi:hypothetical protein